MARLGFDRRGRGAFWGIAVFLGVMALVAAIFFIARNARDFELDRWQARLTAGSVQPLDMVNNWLSDSRGAMRSVALNPTVRIYLSEIAAAKDTPQPVANADAQIAFLASYIASLGGHGAFAATPEGGTGLAVMDAQHHVIASTPGYRPPPEAIAGLFTTMKTGSSGPLAMRGGDVAFAAAILPIQGGGAPVGYVVGTRRPARGFWMSMAATISADDGHEALVATGPDGGVLLIGSSLAAKQMRFSPVMAEAMAARTPRKLVEASDLAGAPALALGVPVRNTDWVLVASVPAAAALSGVDARIRNLVLILLLSLLAIVLGVLALWRHLIAQQQIAARESNIRLYRGAAEMLLEAIDQRDPGAAAHSRRVAELSRKMALGLGARPEDADVAELAGALMNVGKLFVPVDILTKRGALEQSEASLFAEGNSRWLALLGRTSFDPAVEPVLRDAYRLGRGGMEGSTNIVQSAYIIVAANIAVALMSVRAYRPAHSPAQTIEIIAQSGLPLPVPVLAALSDLISEEQ